MALMALVGAFLSVILEWLGVWDWPGGFGHHPWGVVVFAVLVPSTVIVLTGYEAWSRNRRLRRPSRGG